MDPKAAEATAATSSLGGCQASEQYVASKDGQKGPLIDHAEGQRFLNDTFKVIMEEVLSKGADVKEKVCEWRDPAELRRLLDLELLEDGQPHDHLLQQVKEMVKYSVKTNHPRFYNQLRFLTEALNTSQYTYEVAPVFVLMEDVVLSKLRSLVGWSDGDGIFCPGGSVSNIYAMNLARYRAFPQVKLKGLWSVPRLAVFTSEEGHYSICKAASMQGIGLENVFLVKTNESGCMLPEDLTDKIELAKSQGAVPFLVSATSGTTIHGAFDPLDLIADICEKYGLWMLLGGGGSVLFSKKHRHLMKGIERADSMTWNPHKMLLTGLQCSAFLLKDTTDLLKHCHCANVTYLFQKDKFYDVSFDTGDKSIQCGHKVDCLKLWLMWKAVGTRGLEERVDKAFFYTRYLVQEMKKKEGFQLVTEPQFMNVCFWFIPPSLRGKQNSDYYQERLSKVAPAIKERMVRQGSMMIGYQPQAGRVNFFPMIVHSPQISEQDVHFLLNEIERLGGDL
uniref:Cysteine sulfinic acid decarboxylase n=1 Tax=Scleropages formosus TaxID=113540 RepID=A0A8C9W5B8_SCLFO